MPKASEKIKRKAQELYAGGTKLIDISKKLNIPAGTIRRWKSEQKWDEVPPETNERSEERTNARKERRERSVEIAKRDIDSVMENDDLTEKQKMFCLYYVRCLNATKAYQKAYGVEYSTAASIGYRLLAKDGVKKEIDKLKRNRLNIEFLRKEDIVQKYMDIAFSDITDYVEFGNDKYTDPETEEEKTYTFVNLKNSKNVDGTIISEVSKGKDGAKIKLNDRMKALEWLSNYFEMNPADNHKREYDKRKLEIEVTKMEMQVRDTEHEEEAEDNFLEALSGSAEGVWDDSVE